MLSLIDSRTGSRASRSSPGGSRGANVLGRRNFLAAGSLALGGLTLPWLLEAEAQAKRAGIPDFVRDKSIFLIFLSGGPSQYETFSPNMEAPAPYRSELGEIATSLPGITFASPFPRLAERARRLAVVRSFVPSESISEHGQATANLLSGGTRRQADVATGFPLGALAAKIGGGTNPLTGMPNNIYLAGGSHASQHYGFFLRAQAPGTLGAGLAGMMLEPAKVLPRDDQTKPTGTPGPNPLLEDMTLRVSPRDLNDRFSLLKQLDQAKRSAERLAEKAGDPFLEQALDVLHGKAAESFDVDSEPKESFARYDTSEHHVRLKEHPKDNRGFKFDPAIANYGRYLLLGRRLIEAGARFVTAQMAGWDMHADDNNPSVAHGMQMLGPALDKALSALLDDLEERGLSEKVLVVVTGEFGRTGRFQGEGGRNHWAQLAPLLFYGGGLKTGQAIGKTDRENAVAVEDRFTLDDLVGTIFHTLFDPGKLRVASGVSPELLQFLSKTPPPRLLG